MGKVKGKEANTFQTPVMCKAHPLFSFSTLWGRWNCPHCYREEIDMQVNETALCRVLLLLSGLRGIWTQLTPSAHVSRPMMSLYVDKVCIITKKEGRFWGSNFAPATWGLLLVIKCPVIFPRIGGLAPVFCSEVPDTLSLPPHLLHCNLPRG